LEDRNGCGWKNIGRYVILSFVFVFAAAAAAAAAVVVVVVVVGEIVIP